jgi:hypothetical protein
MIETTELAIGEEATLPQAEALPQAKALARIILALAAAGKRHIPDVLLTFVCYDLKGVKRRLMMKRPPGYLSYLLRLWQSGHKDRAVWHASLESPMTGERLGFASLKELFAFLEAQAEEIGRPGPGHDEDLD